MNQRRGASISVKMIVTSTLLILIIVALFGTLTIMNIGRVFDEQAREQGDIYVKSLRARAAVQTRDLVQASRAAILQSDYSTLQSFVPELAKGDSEVAYLLVADK